MIFLKCHTKILTFASAFLLAVSSCDKKAEPNPQTEKSDIAVIDTVKADFDKPAEVIYDTGLETPRFSCEGGFFSDDLVLELSTENKELEIRYTTNGSVPTKDSFLYTCPVVLTKRSGEPDILAAVTGIGPESSAYVPKSVAKGTVIRAAVFDKNGISGPVETNTYFVGISQQDRYNGLPVVSLSTNAYNLFDYEKGIYVSGKAYDEWKQTEEASIAEDWEYEGNYSQKGRDWERPVHMELIEPDGKVQFEQDLGIRIMGKATRTYNQKSFRLYAREEYGKKKIEYPLIPGLSRESEPGSELSEYKTFLLRNGGNDCDYVKLRDPFVQSIAAGKNFATQGSRPAVVFINGEYWGVYAIEEDYTDNSIQYDYGVDNKDVVMIKKGELEEGEEADLALYEELCELIESDLSNEKNYQKLCEKVDIESFADYFAIVIYTANEDCMTIGNNNWRIWRSRSVSDMPYQDGRWRFLLYDTEFSLGLYKGGENGRLDSLKTALESEWFGSLMKNRSFAELFEASLLETAERFKTENSFPVLESLASLYAPVAPDCFRRFGPVWLMSYNPDNGRLEEHYNEGLRQIRKFLEDRYVFVPEMLEKSMPDFG
ncbi:MAG: spore coat protein CotH [Ruminococcus sp.]|nr:spore coat protein CotH [Ruminococcus sp.]